MCTVTLLPRQRGYALAMNRDEKLARVTGLPPSKRILDGRVVLAPSEPGGGTWIALNDAGVTFALINWYAIRARVATSPVSRGDVVNAVCALDAPDSASAGLGRLPLGKINPFRLIGIFPATKGIVEWRWDLKRLIRKQHRWQAQQWISSGFDEPMAQRVRDRTFRRVMQQKSAETLDWLRRLHRSHLPETGPFSTCMHRADAATVSYTEVAVSPGKNSMRHHAVSPCESGPSSMRAASL